MSHMNNVHLSPSPRYCLYCNIIFSSNAKFMLHLNTVHGLPDWRSNVNQEEKTAGLVPSEQAFNGLLKVYNLPIAKDEIDLMSVMRDCYESITQIIGLNVQGSPQKLQFIASLKLTKPAIGDDIGTQSDELQPLFITSRMENVGLDGLSNTLFVAMIEKMLQGLHNFATNGSGWTVHSINHVEMRMVRVNAITPSSYLPLPTHLAGSRALLNIRNQYDNNCFLYCYTASYHQHFGPNLVEEGAASRFLKSNPVTYMPRDDISVKQHEGDYEMPMSFHQMERFEKQNRVRVNVFRLVTRKIHTHTHTHTYTQ